MTLLPPSVSEAVADALEAQVVMVPADDHNYRFSTNHEIILKMVITSATAFFMYNFGYDKAAATAIPVLPDGKILALGNL